MCDTCGDMVEVVHDGPGAMVCCGRAMKLLAENTTGAAREKPAPMMESMSDGVKVIVGTTPHPTEEKPFIEWIELSVGDCTYRRYLRPGDPPEAFFPVNPAPSVCVREYCTLHGLWKV